MQRHHELAVLLGQAGVDDFLTWGDRIVGDVADRHRFTVARWFVDRRAEEALHVFLDGLPHVGEVDDSAAELRQVGRLGGECSGCLVPRCGQQLGDVRVAVTARDHHGLLIVGQIVERVLTVRDPEPDGERRLGLLPASEGDRRGRPAQTQCRAVAGVDGVERIDDQLGADRRHPRCPLDRDRPLR